MICEKCGKEDTLFTGFSGEGMDARDAENTPDNLPGGCAWLCPECLDAIPYAP